jgi:hypothetical protein
MPVEGDSCLKNCKAASNPPAEEPMATIGKDFSFLEFLETDNFVVLLGTFFAAFIFFLSILLMFQKMRQKNTKPQTVIKVDEKGFKAF